MTPSTTKPFTRHRFTIADVERMVSAGILHPDERVELIEGELIDLVPIGWHHQACVDRLVHWFVRALGDSAIVRAQGPIRLSERSAPQPDIAILRPRADFHAEGGPTATDVLLVIDVSDTTLAYDRDIKVPLFARFDIPEVWLVDLANRRVLVYREPTSEGYWRIREYGEGERVTPLTFPDLVLLTDELLGRPSSHG